MGDYEMPYYCLSDLIVMNLWEYCRNHYCSDDLIAALQLFSKEVWNIEVNGKSLLQFVLEKCNYDVSEYDEEAVEEQLECVAKILEKIMAELKVQQLREKIDTAIRETIAKIQKGEKGKNEVEVK